MDNTILVALISAFSVILGSVISYVSSYQFRKLEKQRHMLINAYKDIMSFYRLEEHYTLLLSDTKKTPEAVKREVRKALRDRGYDSPSEEATLRSCESRLRSLLD